MADVFISYKRRMRDRVEAIARALEDLGVSVWYDTELEAGHSFGAVINRELAAAKCVLVCWTADAFAPEDGTEVSWVESEATIGRERKVLVPVRLETVNLNAPWNMLHTESLIDWYPGAPAHTGWQRTLASIGRLVGRPSLGAVRVSEAAAAAPLPAAEPPTGPATAPAPLVSARRVVGALPIGPTRTTLAAAIFVTLAVNIYFAMTQEYFANNAGLPLASSLLLMLPFAFLTIRHSVLDWGPALGLALVTLLANFMAMASRYSYSYRSFGTELQIGALTGLISIAIPAVIYLASMRMLRSRHGWMQVAFATLAGVGLMAGASAFSLPSIFADFWNANILLEAIWQVTMVWMVLLPLSPKTER